MGFLEEIKSIFSCYFLLYKQEKVNNKLRLLIKSHENRIESLFQEVVNEIKQLVTQEDTDSLIRRALNQYLSYRFVFKGDSAMQKADNKRQLVIMHLEELLEILWNNYKDVLPVLYESIISDKFSVDECELLVQKYKLYSGTNDSPAYFRKIFLNI